MPFMHKLSRRLASNRVWLAAALASVVACSDTSTDGLSATLVHISVLPRAAALQPAQQQQFVAYGETLAGDSMPTHATWTASGGTIDANGMFTADNAPGTYVVIATAPRNRSLADTSRVTVSALPPTDSVVLDSVVLLPKNPTIALGDSVTFVAFGITSTGDTTTVDVTWSTSSGAIRSNGKGHASYKPDKPGKYKVKGSKGSLADSTTVTVDSTTLGVASVSVTPASPTVYVGQTVQLTATVRDSAGDTLTGRSITWTSNATAVATVSAAGLVGAASPGNATITATSGGQSGTATVTVSAVPVASVSVTPTSPSVYVGQTVQLTATVRDSTGKPLTGRTVTWTSSAGSVATVDNAGLVHGVGAGTATVTATSEGKSGTSRVTVAPVPVASVRVTPATATVAVGDSVRLTATPLDSAGNALTGRVVTWATSAPATATVDATGLVTVRAAATATIAATSEGQTGSAVVTGQSGSFLPPDILNTADFETGWDGLANWSGGTPTGVDRSTTHAFTGSYSVHRTIPVTSGSDIGTQFTYWPGNQDHVFYRTYFYLGDAFNGIMKFARWEGSSSGLGGFFMANGQLAWDFDREANAQFINLMPLSALAKGWHWCEADYWRNGDPSGYPSVAIWVDGVQITSSTSQPSPTYWSGGRLYAGERGTSDPLQWIEWIGTLNGVPNNTIPTDIWVDRLAISTHRIGP